MARISGVSRVLLVAAAAAPLACSESPLGPEITAPAQPTDDPADESDGVSGGTGQPSSSSDTDGGTATGGSVTADGTTGGTTDDADGGTTDSTDGGTTTADDGSGSDDGGASDGSTGGAAFSCSETTTRNVYYPGASVTHTISCNAAITSVSETNKPAFLGSGSVSGSTVTYTGTPGASLAATSWSVEVNGDVDVNLSTQVLSTTPTYAADASATLADNTVEAISATGTLDAAYDGTSGVTMTVIPYDVSAVPADGAVTSYVSSDIPLLAYTDGTCSSLTAPYICPTSGSFTDPNVTGGFDLRWNYDVFDQGQYNIRTKGLITADGATVLSAADSTYLTTSNVTGEKTTMTGSTAITGSSAYLGNTAWFQYVPQIALGDASSTSPKQVYAVTYAASNTQDNQYAGIATIDRASSSSTLSKTWFDPTTAASRLSNSVNGVYMALAAAESEEWIALGGHDGTGGSRNLVLNRLVYNAGTPALTRVALSGLSDGSLLADVAITPKFSDGGTQRHGIAFFAHWIGNGSRRLYVSKIRSSPAATTEADYFDAGAYYDTTAGNPLNGTVDSVPIIPDQASTLSLVRIVNAVVGGANYFYVGWRKHTDGKVYFARVEASSAGDPAVVLTEAGDEIANMDSGSVRGRPSYAIAGGKDVDGNDILGVLYAEKTGSDINCNFQAFQVVAGELERYGSVLNLGAATDCRFPHLYWNSDVSLFMAVYVNSTSGDTMFSQFAFDGDGAGAFDPPSPGEVTVTDRTALPCLFSASYSSTWQRIGLISIEGACGAAGHSMLFDTYKTPR